MPNTFLQGRGNLLSHLIVSCISWARVWGSGGRGLSTSQGHRYCPPTPFHSRVSKNLVSFIPEEAAILPCIFIQLFRAHMQQVWGTCPSWYSEFRTVSRLYSQVILYCAWAGLTALLMVLSPAPLAFLHLRGSGSWCSEDYPLPILFLDMSISLVSFSSGHFDTFLVVIGMFYTAE